MKYKVGDTVKIRSDLVVGEFYGGVQFRYSMRTKLGDVISIRKLHSIQTNRYRLVSSLGSWWTIEMFESVDAKISFNYLIL